MDTVLFRAAQFRNRHTNTTYRQQNPAARLPPDYFLYETHQLNYEKFIEDGALAATEIVEWTKPHMGTPEPRVLDWGCGVGRITCHLPLLLPGAALYGCDINEAMIEWDKANLQGIAFTAINNFAPTPYAPSFFDLVYGMSIFTHIPASEQLNWIIELNRIIKAGGILLITTQGSYYDNKLLSRERKILNDEGAYTQAYSKHGHRMMSTYNQAEHFTTFLEPYFFLVEFYAGEKYTNKIGGQDLWILKKK